VDEELAPDWEPYWETHWLIEDWFDSTEDTFESAHMDAAMNMDTDTAMADSEPPPPPNSDKMRRVFIDPLWTFHDATFNTSFHSLAELPTITAPDFRPFKSEAPYSYKRWLPLILRSRRTQRPSTTVQTITLTLSQVRLLLSAASGSILTGRINLMYAEDLHEEITQPSLSKLTFPPEGLFCQMDLCSPKDGAHVFPDRRALHGPEEVLLRIVTSMRARGALVAAVEGEGDDHVERRSSDTPTIEIYFLPFDKRMGAENEYRVFCRPGDGKITGISQYQWHKEWKLAALDRAGRYEAMVDIAEGARSLRRQIVAHMEEA